MDKEFVKLFKHLGLAASVFYAVSALLALGSIYAFSYMNFFPKPIFRLLDLSSYSTIVFQLALTLCAAGATARILLYLVRGLLKQTVTHIVHFKKTQRIRLALARASRFSRRNEWSFSVLATFLFSGVILLNAWMFFIYAIACSIFTFFIFYAVFTVRFRYTSASHMRYLKLDYSGHESTSIERRFTAAFIAFTLSLVWASYLLGFFAHITSVSEDVQITTISEKFIGAVVSKTDNGIIVSPYSKEPEGFSAGRSYIYISYNSLISVEAIGN